MSVEQIETTIEAMPVKERRKFARWFDTHRHELLGETDVNVTAGQQAELLLRRREYEQHPERFTRMDKKSLNRMFTRVRKDVASRLSSAR